MDSDEILKAELKKAVAECERLREENARLRLRVNDAPVNVHPTSKQFTADHNKKAQASATLTVDSPPEAKVSLFRSVFRGRDDVYPVRWEGRTGKAGYSPAGVREWDAASSKSQKRSFHYSKLFPLSEEVIRDHLLGKHTIGVYPLLQDDTCWFVAVDFDKKNWQADALSFLKTCNQTGVPAALERSRSGNGGHVWIFFASPVQSALARKLASAVLTRTMERRYALGLDSYDRLFPSQDTMPKGGFGNLIALPLQHGPRENGNTVFVDDELRPFDDQWAFLSRIKRLTPDETQALLRKMYPAGDVINIKHSASDYDEAGDPWILPPSGLFAAKVITETLPSSVSIKLGNLIYVEKKDLPDVFLDRLIRLAAFQNPEFYSAQAMRLSTFGKPRVISCAEDLAHHIALPRGLLKEVLDLLQSHGIAVDVSDHRFSGVPIQVDFHGDRRASQAEAAKALAACDDGILCASDSIWQDGRCCTADCEAQSEHAGVSSSPSLNGSMARAIGPVPRA
jgi:hypothetical protein